MTLKEVVIEAIQKLCLAQIRGTSKENIEAYVFQLGLTEVIVKTTSIISMN